MDLKDFKLTVLSHAAKIQLYDFYQSVSIFDTWNRYTALMLQ
jgi:hypothetical protein